MDIEWTLVWPLLALLVLTILVTGPGMWSEKWGWSWMTRSDRPSAGGEAARRDGPRR